MTITSINPQSLTSLFIRYQAQLRLAVVVLLSLYLLAFAAELTWRIIPQPTLTSSAQNANTMVATSNSNDSSVNIKRLQALKLFGNTAKAPPPVETTVTDAPETRLNLTLTGVVSSNDKSQGAAIIEHRGDQNTYGLGEKIDGTNATLDQVQFDRVIIRNGARHETLMLDGVDFDEANRRRQQNTQPRAVARRDSPLSQEAIETTNDLRAEPANFTDYIAISPYTAEGQMQGYQVKPGKKPELFSSAGLQNGDVVIQINGLDLTDPQQAMEAMGELRNAQSIELTVNREGEYVTLYLDMPEQEQ